MEMANAKKSSKPSRINIQSKDHEKLLDVIDDLRSQGISRFIDLPQIIVCGDQSSGKSSVLEAVSGLKFPTKDALCTRFATELILRRHPEVASTVTIVPDANRPDAEKCRLLAFKSKKSVYEDFGDIIEQAGKEMGLEGTTKVFSTDVLRIELSGPDQPHLTLVDLPGLFHSGSKSQSDADAEAVKALVTGYMAKPRSIILAVVSAKNDYNNQIVTKYARHYDPAGERTLGIITKPDTLSLGSDSEQQYFELAQNKDVYFRLGWHVLKNRDYERRNCSNEERDASEKLFFSKGIWSALGGKQVGIESLKSRLSKVLQGQILNELPGLMKDVESGLKDCQMSLDVLGGSRGNIAEQRLHLHTISEAFSSVVKQALDGRYENEYFGDATDDKNYAKRIRAVTANLLTQFSHATRLKGHKYEIVQQPPERQAKVSPFCVSKEERLELVKALINRNRGKELATVSKEQTITYLFRDQSSPWKPLVMKYAEAIFDAVNSAVLAALEYTCDQSTREGVFRYVVKPALDQIKERFNDGVRKTLKPYIEGHPMTYNHYLTENLQNLRNEHNKEHMAELLKQFFGKDPRSNDHVATSMNVNVRSLMNALTVPNEADMTLFACSEALHVMEAYYKVAMKNFVDDFAQHGVEEDLLMQLETLFTTTSVLKLDDELVEDIAGETEDSKEERESSTAKLKALKSALELLKKLDRGNTV